MEISVNECFSIVLKKIYNPLYLKSERCTLMIAERDGGFEIIHDGQHIILGCQAENELKITEEGKRP